MAKNMLATVEAETQKAPSSTEPTGVQLLAAKPKNAGQTERAREALNERSAETESKRRVSLGGGVSSATGPAATS